MLTHEFSIPIFDFSVQLLQIETPQDSNPFREEAVRFGMKKEDIEEECARIERDAKDGGNIYRNGKFKRFLVVFYNMTSVEEREQVWAHEKRHIEDRIMQFCGIDDIETAGYIAGYLGKEFHKLRTKATL